MNENATSWIAVAIIVGIALLMLVTITTIVVVEELRDVRAWTTEERAAEDARREAALLLPPSSRVPWPKPVDEGDTGPVSTVRLVRPTPVYIPKRYEPTRFVELEPDSRYQYPN